MKQMQIGVVVGSLRKESFSRKTAKILISMLPDAVDAEILDISGLELYNQDYDDEGTIPRSWDAFRKKVKEKNAYLFVTPEYNRSVPPVLKNALDIASRPYGHNNWGGKPGAVISVSPGSMGGFGANHHLRQSVTFLDIYMMQQPEAYLSNVAASFSPAGELLEERTKRYLQNFADGFIRWIEQFRL